MTDKNKIVCEQENISITMEILAELKIQNIRLMTVLKMVLIFWAITIGAFLLYLNQYDFTSSIVQTGFYTFSDSNGNVISADISQEEMREILEVINGKNKGD